jgi:hypothetical protein
MNIFIFTSIITSPKWVKEMQAFYALVTLAPINDFIFKKKPLVKPYKTLLKQNT